MDETWIAVDHMVPSMLIFLGNMKLESMDDTILGSEYACNCEVGCRQICSMIAPTFCKETKLNKDGPIVYVLDGYSRRSNINIIKQEKKNHVSMLCLPPTPLKTSHFQDIKTYIGETVGRNVTTFQAATLFKEAFVRAACTDTAVSELERRGEVPENRDVFRPRAYAIHDSPNSYLFFSETWNL
jgi:hypothetical protein